MATCQLDTDLLAFFLYKYPQPASDRECIGMQELARAVGDAWKRAKERDEVAKKTGKRDPVYKKWSGERPKRGLALVQYLSIEDGGFKPGTWYPDSDFAKLKSGGRFVTKIRAVEAKVAGWSWESWKST